MPLERVSAMTEQPNCCTLCGSTPTDNDGQLKPAIFASGVDVDWGNAVYICWECGEIISDLMGRATRFGFDELEGKYNALKAEHDELLEEYETQEGLLDKIREGNTAQKTIRAKARA